MQSNLGPPPTHGLLHLHRVHSRIKRTSIVFSSDQKMNFFTQTELFTSTEGTTKEATPKKTTTDSIANESTSTRIVTEDPEFIEEKTGSLIPITEAKKDIILLAALGTLVFGLLAMVVVCICRRRRLRSRAKQNLEMFESLAASSSTTVFDKDQ